MDTRNLVDMILADNKEGAETAFNSIISNKISNALEIKKVELASQTFNAPTGVNEAMTDRQLASVVGSGDAPTRQSLQRLQKTGVEKLSLKDKNNLLKMFPRLFAANKTAIPSSVVRKAFKDTEN